MGREPEPFKIRAGELNASAAGRRLLDALCRFGMQAPGYAPLRLDPRLVEALSVIRKHWLHAIQSVQSGRFPHDPHVAANLARPAAGFLAEFMEGKVLADCEDSPSP